MSFMSMLGFYFLVMLPNIKDLMTGLGIITLIGFLIWCVFMGGSTVYEMTKKELSFKDTIYV